MTTKHDYMAALRKIVYQASYMTEKEKREDIAPLKVTLRPSEIASVIHALKVAHAVMQEPSDVIAFAGEQAAEQTIYGSALANPKDVFKAMRDKMLEGVE